MMFTTKEKKSFLKFPPELAKHYEDKHKELGTGGFAKVVLAEHIATREKVAIKIMNKEYLAKKDDLHRAYNEIYALKSLIHPHICQLYEVVETDLFIYLVIEYCPGGELFDYIVSKKRLSEKETRHVFRQIISAVAFIHKHGYAHRDLKPENMLLDGDKNIKIIDFGLSAKPENGLKSPLHTRAGSALYASPELISGQPYFGNETDVWSLGIVLYALLCGFLPFDHETTAELYRRIKKGAFAIPPWLSTRSLRLLKEMIQVNAQKRISVNDIIKHDWLTTGYSEPLQWDYNFQRKNLNRTAVQLLSEYYHWEISETEKTILELRYNHLTAFYFLLCKMSQQKLRKFQNTWFGKSKGSQEKLLNTHLQVPDQDQSSQNVEGYRERSSTIDSPFLSQHSKQQTNDNEQIPYHSHRRRSKTMETITKEIITATNGLGFKSNAISEQEEKKRSQTQNDPLIVITEAKTKRSHTISRDYVNAEIISSHLKTKQGEDVPKATNLHDTKRLAASCIDNLNRIKDEHKKEQTLRQPYIDHYQHKSRSLDAHCTLKEVLMEEETEKRPRTRSMKEFTQKLSGLFRPASGPRRVKAIYHVENTSTLSASAVRVELDRVLTLLVKNNVLSSYSNSERYLFKCKVGTEKKTVFELEVCLIPFVDNVVGIRRKRLKGDAWKYKEIVEHVLALARI